jgi:DNA polymerase-3 subunit epsilon
MIRRCLIVDTETTSLDPATGHVVEIGVILYSLEHRTSLAHFASLIAAPENPAESINGIPVAALSDRVPEGADIIGSLAADAEAIVAHNAEFDRAWLSGVPWSMKPWLCTMSDFAWPRGQQGSSLVSLALAHGIGVSSAHRALTDCLLIAELFSRASLFGCDLDEMFVRAMRPKALFQSLQPFDQNEIAKSFGFQWNKPGALREKRWTRRMAIEDVAALPFRTLRIDP